MNISIIIPNYNGLQLLKKNIPRILEAAPRAEIIIVDDASEDSSVEFLRKTYPDIHVIEKDKNDGFAATVNIGVKKATNEIILLLNSDAYPEKDFLVPIEQHFTNNAVFAVGMLQKSIEDTGTEFRGRGIGGFQRGFLVHARGDIHEMTTLWVSGGAGFFRKSIWDHLGGMSELYNPFYWEDIDLSYFAVKSGYEIHFEPQSSVIHEQSIGSIRTKYSSTRISTIAFRNQIIFMWLNISDVSLMMAHILWMPYHVVRTLLHSDRSFLYGFFLACIKLPAALTERRRRKGFWKRLDRAVLI